MGRSSVVWPTGLADETAVPVHLVATPLECVVVGAGMCLDSFDSLRPIFAAAEA